MAATAPVAAQQTAEGDAPSGTPGGFESIDGTKLRPAALSYDATMKMEDRSLNLSSSLTVTSTTTGGTDTWTIVNKIETPQSANTDSLIAHRPSLLPVSRHRRGGPVMDLTYSDTSVTGEARRNGEPVPIRASLEGPTLAGGVHDVIALGAMPLEPGYRAALRVFSPQDQSTKRAEFEVVGMETVKTPAGSFETYVVDLDVGNGYVTGTVHLRKEPPRYYVKWNTEVSTPRGTRTIRQTLSSMEMQ